MTGAEAEAANSLHAAEAVNSSNSAFVGCEPPALPIRCGTAERALGREK